MLKTQDEWNMHFRTPPQIENTMLLILTIAMVLLGCENQPKIEPSDSKVEVKKAWEALYEHYANGDLRFTDYYQDDVIRMGTTGEYRTGKKVFKEGWQKYYEENEVKLLDYSQPTILESQDQSVTFNTYKEIFIDKETRDTTYVEGTWIAVWKRQDDKSWKIRMSTWHHAPEQKSTTGE